jgi:hypothetical protein
VSAASFALDILSPSSFEERFQWATYAHRSCIRDAPSVALLTTMPMRSFRLSFGF